MKSALYTGTIRHRRFGPAGNEFAYRLFMSYLDLAELPAVFERRWFWSVRRPALARFERTDFLGPPEVPLDTAVRDLVAARTGARPAGPIRLLTHLRFFGYSFNPVSFYYVFDAADEHVETIVAEITNTPWKERHAYVLPVAGAKPGAAHPAGARAWRFEFDKEFHVSPFLPMDMHYRWNFGAPAAGLHVHMENRAAGDGPDAEPLFDATLNLRREPITGRSLARALLNFPLMTTRVVALIHWQALKLWLKRVPFHVHPAKLKKAQAQPQT
ncbi:MAG TPA: DUF1365 domain-containing protein [Steroidobacteraceae bacterium]|nr:DUF1365 domain-containing protein [Steroidobacteraceae bacterium]